MDTTRMEEDYDAARAAAEEMGLLNLSLVQLQQLIAGEVWSDGGEPEVAIETSHAYDTVDAARHYLVQAFGYQE